MYYVYGVCPECLRVVRRQPCYLDGLQDVFNITLAENLRVSARESTDAPACPVSHAEGCEYMKSRRPKTYRPWKLEEVKLGQPLRHKNSFGSQGMITGRAENFTPGAGVVITIGSKGYAASSVLTDFEHLDGTPCGVFE